MTCIILDMSFFRVQHPDRNTADLIDPEQQVSVSYCTDTVRQGVSVCRSVEELAAYLVQTGIPFDHTWVVVEVTGTRSADEDEDAELGALLVHPTEIISVAPITDQVWDLIDTYLEEAA